MRPRRTELEPGFILHSFAYKETSLIAEAFTRHHGRIALLARGARRPRSVMRGNLLAFHPLRLSWGASGELKTLHDVEWASGRRALTGRALMCGFYLNELLLRLLPKEDAHENLYDAYSESLAELGDGAPQARVLRGFECRMLGELGYAPSLDREAESGAPIEPGAQYAYDPERGPIAWRDVQSGDRPDTVVVVGGQTLLDVARNDYERARTRDEARQLMRALIARRLGGQSLYTRSVLQELQDL